MCGIIGLYSSAEEPIIKKKIHKAMDDLSHRGPDDSGTKSFHINNNLLMLGHTRLSIIDLTRAGQQPMESQDGRYAIAFNGEIYNYKELRDELKLLGCKFITNTDTEVLLNLYKYYLHTMGFLHLDQGLIYHHLFLIIV